MSRSRECCLEKRPTLKGGLISESFGFWIKSPTTKIWAYASSLKTYRFGKRRCLLKDIICTIDLNLEGMFKLLVSVFQKLGRVEYHRKNHHKPTATNHRFF